MTSWWVLWFVITVLGDELAHFPVDDRYASQSECEANLDIWRTLIEEQFPNDPNVDVYCELFTPSRPTKEL